MKIYIASAYTKYGGVLILFHQVRNRSRFLLVTFAIQKKIIESDGTEINAWIRLWNMSNPIQEWTSPNGSNKTSGTGFQQTYKRVFHDLKLGC